MATKVNNLNIDLPTNSLVTPFPSFYVRFHIIRDLWLGKIHNHLTDGKAVTLRIKWSIRSSGGLGAGIICIVGLRLLAWSWNVLLKITIRAVWWPSRLVFIRVLAVFWGPCLRWKGGRILEPWICRKCCIFAGSRQEPKSKFQEEPRQKT